MALRALDGQVVLWPYEHIQVRIQLDMCRYSQSYEDTYSLSAHAAPSAAVSPAAAITHKHHTTTALRSSTSSASVY